MQLIWAQELCLIIFVMVSESMSKGVRLAAAPCRVSSRVCPVVSLCVCAHAARLAVLCRAVSRRAAPAQEEARSFLFSKEQQCCWGVACKFKAGV